MSFADCPIHGHGMRFRAPHVHITKCLIDTNYEQNFNQTVLSKFGLKGTHFLSGINYPPDAKYKQNLNQT